MPLSSPDVLIDEARRVRERAYAPYSGFAVGAALLSADGAVYTGCNVESAAFGVSLCAERVALGRAVSEGRRMFLRLAVVAGGARPVVPCGACRQALAEFGDLEVVAANLEGEVYRARLSELLPEPFRGEFLPHAGGGGRQAAG